MEFGVCNLKPCNSIVTFLQTASPVFGLKVVIAPLVLKKIVGVTPAVGLGLPSLHLGSVLTFPPFSLSPLPILGFVQLRVVRAFKSTLEDVEDKRSIHSIHSLHSLRSSRSHPSGRPLSDISFIDEDGKTPSPASDPVVAGRHPATRLRLDEGSPVATPRSSASSSSSPSSGLADNNNRASFSNPLTQGYNLLSEPPVGKLHETSI